MTGDAAMRSTLTHLLSNVRDGKEIRTYLERFGAADRGGFAIIKLGGAILRDDLEAVAENLALLNTLGLKPIVIHGVGPQFDVALEERGLVCPKIDGLRTTPYAALDVLSSVSVSWTLKLVAAIQAYGARAVPVPPSAITAEYLDKDKYGAVGDPTSVAEDQILAITDAGAIPVLSCLGTAPHGQMVNINADAIVRQVAMDLKPMKIVFVTGTGGVLDANKQIINAINLSMDYEDIRAGTWVNEGMLVKITEIKNLLDQLPSSTSVSITSASGLVRELFTHGGAGTLLRRGEQIKRFDNPDDIDWPRLERLIETAFDRKMKPGFRDSIEFKCAYVAESYRCAAVMTKVNGAVVLDKFAVAPDARGEGLSRAMWRQLTHDLPVFYWRSRAENAFNAFYTAEADGFMRRGFWNVFWVGDRSAFDVHVLDLVTDAPESFGPRGNE